MATSAPRLDDDGRGVFPCARCGRAFSREGYLALHLGRDHASTLTAEERAAFARAHADEEAWLQVFRRHVRAGMNTLPIALVFLVVLLLVGVSGIPVVFGLLLAPGAIGFGALIYYVSYTK